MAINETINLDYWRSKLLTYLLESNRNLLIIKEAKNELIDFVNNRASAAELEYYNASINGFNDSEAKEIANKVLFDGIEFSRTEFIEKTMIDHFSAEYEQIPEAKLDTFIWELSTHLHSVFNHFLSNKQKDLSEVESAVLPHIKRFISQNLSNYLS